MSAEPTAIERAAWALRRGDPLGVLVHTQGLDDHLALAIRGAALAQLEEHRDAVTHLERAVAAATHAGDLDAVARATLALAEVQIAERDLSGAALRLAGCERALGAQPANRVLAAVLRARVALLRGEASAASGLLASVASTGDPFLDAVLCLSRAELCLASGAIDDANAALGEAHALARRARHAFLLAEIEAGIARLSQPIARVRCEGREVPFNSLELARARHDGALLDTLRATLTCDGHSVDLSRRPILFAIVRALVEADGAPVPATELVRSFGAKSANEAHRANLRVEIGRLRKLLPRASIELVSGGYRFVSAAPIPIVLPLAERLYPEIGALLSDGQAWRCEEIASALATSTRTVQRRLSAMREAGLVSPTGSGRHPRWSSTSPDRLTLLGQVSALSWGRQM